MTLLSDTIARELRKALRRLDDIDDKIGERQGQLKHLRAEREQLSAAVDEYREALQGSEYDETGRRVKEEE